MTLQKLFEEIQNSAIRMAEEQQLHRQKCKPLIADFKKRLGSVLKL